MMIKKRTMQLEKGFMFEPDVFFCSSTIFVPSGTSLLIRTSTGRGLGLFFLLMCWRKC